MILSTSLHFSMHPFLNYHNEAFRPRELPSTLSTCQSMINCEIKTKIRNRRVSTRENKSLVYNVQSCWKWGPRTVLEEKFPKPLPLASVLTSGNTALHLTGSVQSPPLAPDAAGPTLPTENLGGNSHRHPDTGTSGQNHPPAGLWMQCWPLLEPQATSPRQWPALPLLDTRPLCPLTYSTQMSKHALAQHMSLLPLNGLYFSNRVLKLNHEIVGMRTVLATHIRPGLIEQRINQDKSYHR